MLTVTDAARDRLSRKLELRNAEERMALRLTRTERGWGLRPDTARPDDTAFEHQGKNVLLVDDAVSEAMAEVTLEVRNTKAGPRLRLRKNPKQGG